VRFPAGTSILAVAAALAAVACGAARARPVPPPAPPAPAITDAGVSAQPDAAPPVDAGQADTAPTAENAEPAPACPPGMIHVKKDFCPKMERHCLETTYDKPNHLHLCLKFEKGVQKCVAPRVPLDFCIDKYEYPDKKGAHPPVMVNWYQAMGTCAAEGKRLCYESEWTAACEGPDERPFPHGWIRSKKICNIDNTWIKPSLAKIYSKNPAVSGPELKRLDQSVPSGSMPNCVSGYGVYDMTGNFDEWTLADHDRPKEHAVFVALKGGAWGHVRNACRPVTTSHYPTFSYYFVSFRCCKDAAYAPVVPGTADR
jgi:Sulfatase-modifying factor enzyme 1